MPTLKNRLRSIIHSTARNDQVYRRFWHPLIRLSALAARERDGMYRTPDEEEMRRARKLINQVVLDGPFAGMRYPRLESVSSTMFPKLLGSYEFELHDVIHQVLQGGYSGVVDIGCAEGYYAVGLARGISQARVWAFDIQPRGRECCAEMARINGVADRVTIESICDRDRLISFAAEKRMLFFCDCEGYERQLFDAQVAQILKSHDLVIEVHDIFVPGTLAYLLKVFAESHRVTVIDSVPDILRPRIFPLPQLRSFSRNTQISLMAERRPLPMQWIFCRSRSLRQE